MGVSGEQAAQRAPEAVFRPSRGGRGAAGSPPPHGLADASAGKEMDELFFNPVFIQTLPQNALTIFLAQNPRRHARQGFLRNPSSRKIRNTLRTLMFSLRRPLRESCPPQPFREPIPSLPERGRPPLVLPGRLRLGDTLSLPLKHDASFEFGDRANWAERPIRRDGYRTGEAVKGLKAGQ